MTISCVFLLKDIRKTPSLTLSKLVPIGRQVTDRTISCRAGDVIKVRVDLVDRYGKVRGHGLDSVIAWMVEVMRDAKKGQGKGKGQGQTGKIGARAGAEVVDLKNGSYVVEYRCLWPGSTSKVSA